MTKSAAAMKANPSGLLLYHPAGQGVTDMAGPLIREFVKELIQSLIAAFIVSMIAAAFFSRVIYVTLIGITGTLMTNASYWTGMVSRPTTRLRRSSPTLSAHSWRDC